MSVSTAVSMLCPVDNLAWYEVSSIVNNSRNKSEDCNKPTSKMYVYIPLKYYLNILKCLYCSYSKINSTVYIIIGFKLQYLTF